jgi:hypothetical protein
MKKISIVSSLFFLTAVVFSMLAFNQQPPDPNDGFYVTVYGCEDCKAIYYCVNGGPEIKSLSKTFFVNCDGSSDSQFVCVRCCNDRYGSATVVCGTVINVNITVSPDNKPCYCGDAKKTR